MPPPLILVGHNIVHGQLNHEHYARKQIELRQLLDFAICAPATNSRSIGESSTGASAASAWDMCWRRTCDMTGRCSVSVCRISAAPRKHAVRRLRYAMEFPLVERRQREAELRAREWEKSRSASSVSGRKRRSASSTRRSFGYVSGSRSCNASSARRSFGHVNWSRNRNAGSVSGSRVATQAA